VSELFIEIPVANEVSINKIIGPIIVSSESKLREKKKE